MSHDNARSDVHCTSRRRFVTRSVAAGIAAVTGPWVISSSTLASSGEVNVLMWQNYLPEAWRQAFTDETGIQVNFTAVQSNEEILNKMNATRGKGIDICSPTSIRSGQWVDLELLSPWDLSAIPNYENLYPGMLSLAQNAWNFNDAGPHWLPHIWGTEGIGWRTDSYRPPQGRPSFGNVWTGEKSAGKAIIRAHSGMLGAGLFMETIGELNPGDVWSAYESEERMRLVWDKIAQFCLSRKQRIGRLWDNAKEQSDAFLEGSIVVGQTWDMPLLNLKADSHPVSYQAPEEGALTWVDGMSLSRQSENVDQAYEFVKFCCDAKASGMAINEHQYNSAVTQAESFANDKYRANFAEAYPRDSIQRLNYLPFEPQWYIDLRTEYSHQLEELFVDG